MSNCNDNYSFFCQQRTIEQQKFLVKEIALAITQTIYFGQFYAIKERQFYVCHERNMKIGEVSNYTSNYTDNNLKHIFDSFYVCH